MKITLVSLVTGQEVFIVGYAQKRTIVKRAGKNLYWVAFHDRSSIVRRAMICRVGTNCGHEYAMKPGIWTPRNPLIINTMTTINKKQTLTFVRAMLRTNRNWTQRAIVRLHERQTADEQASGMTKDDNGIGFSGIDAKILSSFAQQIEDGRTLSPNQMRIAIKRVPRYARQIATLIPADKLESAINNLFPNHPA